jgi:hypothetical protein
MKKNKLLNVISVFTFLDALRQKAHPRRPRVKALTLIGVLPSLAPLHGGNGRVGGKACDGRCKEHAVQTANSSTQNVTFALN